MSRRTMVARAGLGAGALWIAPTALGLATPPAAASTGTQYIDRGDIQSGTSVDLPNGAAITFYLLLSASNGNGGGGPGVINGPPGWTALKQNGDPASTTDLTRLWGWFHVGHLTAPSVTISKSFAALASFSVILGFSSATTAFKGLVQKAAPGVTVTAPGLGLTTPDVGIFVFFGMARNPSGLPTTWTDPSGYTRVVANNAGLNPGAYVAYTPSTGVTDSVLDASSTIPNALENAGVHIAVY